MYMSVYAYVCDLYTYVEYSGSPQEARVALSHRTPPSNIISVRTSVSLPLCIFYIRFITDQAVSQAPRPSTPLHAPTPTAAPDPSCSSWRCYKEFYFSLLSNVQPKILVYFILLCVCMDVCMYNNNMYVVMFFVTSSITRAAPRQHGARKAHSTLISSPAATSSGGGRRHEPGALRGEDRGGALGPQGPAAPARQVCPAGCGHVTPDVKVIGIVNI